LTSHSDLEPTRTCGLRGYKIPCPPRRRVRSAARSGRRGARSWEAKTKG
jgi:hypothetical protein